MVWWRIRELSEDFDLLTSYAGQPTMFSLRLHYGGEFSGFPGRKYIGGKQRYADLVDIDIFSAHDLDEMMQELECVEEGKVIYYHFKRPTGDLDFGLFALGNDQDVIHLSTYVREHKVIEVYTEFWRTKVHTYAMSPNRPNIRIREIPVPQIRRLYLNWVDPTTGEGSSNGNTVGQMSNASILPDLQPTIDPLTQATLETPSSGVIEKETLNTDVFEQNFHGPEMEKSDDDSEGSEGSTNHSDSEDSQDSDYLVDEDNLLEDPVVDMKDFYQNIDRNAEWVGGNCDATNEVQPSDEDLEVLDNEVLLSDRQKGLLPALAQLFPCAEHRYCLRHIHENMKLKYRGKEFKNCLWKCATACTVPHFNIAMEELKKLNNGAYEWLKAIPPKHWSKSYFTGRAHCDVLLNNMCESFNSQLVKGRDKPIITCLEFIREYIMKKLVLVQKTIDKAGGLLTPTATKTLDQIKSRATNYMAVFCGNRKYQVTAHDAGDQYVVDMGQRSCTCNRWELTGMPCKHTIAAIWEMRLNNEDVGIPETWVHPTYWLKTWKEMYSFKVQPINGKTMWEKSPCPTKLLPPNHQVQSGRPRKKRRRSATEGDEAYKSVTCSKCGNVGHNGRSCKGQKEGGKGKDKVV